MLLPGTEALPETAGRTARTESLPGQRGQPVVPPLPQPRGHLLEGVARHAGQPQEEAQRPGLGGPVGVPPRGPPGPTHWAHCGGGVGYGYLEEAHLGAKGQDHIKLIIVAVQMNEQTNRMQIQTQTQTQMQMQM